MRHVRKALPKLRSVLGVLGSSRVGGLLRRERKGVFKAVVIRALPRAAIGKC